MDGVMDDRVPGGLPRATRQAQTCPIEAFVAFYEGSGLTNMRPDAARVELARLRGLESVRRCNDPCPADGELCDLWPGHEGPHVNATENTAWRNGSFGGPSSKGSDSMEVADGPPEERHEPDTTGCSWCGGDGLDDEAGDCQQCDGSGQVPREAGL